MKIKDTLIVVAILMLSSTIATAQQVNNNITVSAIDAAQQNNDVVVTMSLNGSKANLHSNQALILTPVIKTAENSIDLQSIIINGNNRYKATKRAEFFDKNKNSSTTSAAFVKRSEATNINYSNTVPYETWMDGAHVELKQEIYGCADCKDKEDWNTLVDKIKLDRIIKPDVQFAVTYITPPAETVKNRDKTGSAFLDFPVGKSVIQTDFRNNFRELSKIQEAINQLRNDKDASITSIDLKGFASPEGSYKTNNALSAARSQALKNYLQNQYGYSNNLFNVSSVAEDWDGLKKLVDESSLSDKSSVLDIVNSTLAEDSKEQKLKALGTTYKTLLSEFFPKLRRVEYKLNYTIRAFSVQEGKEIVKTNPAQMSLNEMFLVANTYTKGSEEFNTIFDVAVRLFPKDKVANLNAGAALLDKNNATEALRYLTPYQQEPQSWNNLGIAYALEGNIAKAKEYFTKAQTNGSAEANENLVALKKLEEYKIAKELRDQRIKER